MIRPGITEAGSRKIVVKLRQVIIETCLAKGIVPDRSSWRPERRVIALMVAMTPS
ncbi:MAG: hypothetical protein IH587_06340 [Anaerolineae bacterium]|nr:hypothetical protein [Anaerolineae bacterium]